MHDIICNANNSLKMFRIITRKLGNYKREVESVAKLGFRVELPGFWRMLYTLTDGESEIEIIAFVLDIIDHKKYNKKFRYKCK